MKVISRTNDYGLTAGKEYEVIHDSAAFYRIRLDNGNISYRSAYLFSVREDEDEPDK